MVEREGGARDICFGLLLLCAKRLRAVSGSSSEQSVWSRNFGQMECVSQFAGRPFRRTHHAIVRAAAKVHHSHFESPVLRPGQTYKHHSWHVFSARD